MKAALKDRYGPPEVVRVADVETPVPVDDQILVRVHAASVNRADLDGLGPRPGFVRFFIGVRAPRNHRTGLDAAGVFHGTENTGSEPMHLLAVYSPGGPEAILRAMPDCVTLPPGDWPTR